jgi:hypothetical protein
MFVVTAIGFSSALIRISFTKSLQLFAQELPVTLVPGFAASSNSLWGDTFSAAKGAISAWWLARILFANGWRMNLPGGLPSDILHAQTAERLPFAF